MSARAEILGAIRAKRDGGEAATDDVRAACRARIAAQARNKTPARSALEADAMVDLFEAMAVKADARVDRIESIDRLPDAVAEILAAENLPAMLAAAPDPALQAAPWDRRAMLSLAWGPSDGSHAAALTRADCGAAETGTLILFSGPERPTTLNFLPDLHFVVIRKADIVRHYEDGWDLLRARYGAGAAPRTVNMITGPSRSADIEQTLQLGAHGPRTLRILLVDA